MNVMRRQIRWEPGYDTVEPGKRNGSRHGMNIRWLLHGEHGTVQFLIYSGWLPSWVENDADRWGPRVNPRRALPMSSGGSRPSLTEPMAADLGYHWDTAPYEGCYSTKCDVRPGGQCFYDGSGLNAEPVFAALLTGGEEAVWARMAEYYAEITAEPEVTT